MNKLISIIVAIILLTSAKGELSSMKISIQITSDSGSHKLTATLADNSSALEKWMEYHKPSSKKSWAKAM